MRRNNIFSLSFVMATIVLQTTFSQKDLVALEDKLLEYTIVPGVLQYFPKYYVEVKFPSGAEVELDKSIRVEDMKGVPEVHWEHEASKNYSMVITDIDDEVNRDPLIEEYHLWFVVNIPGDDVSKGYQQFEYIPPKLTSDPHRIVIIVIEQTEYANENITKIINLKRHFFAAMEIVYEYKGIIHAANCFNATI